MKKTKVHAAITRKQKLDIANGTNTTQELADDLGVCLTYLVRTIKGGSYKPPIERRDRLRELLRYVLPGNQITMDDVEYHFSEDSNVNKEKDV